MKKLGLATGALALLLGIILLHERWSDNRIRPTTNAELATVSVSIVNMAQNSGGSGVILSSTSNGSFILTNRHVCGVVKNGGLVRTDDGKLNTVVSYKPSQTHDLCLIQIAENLGTGVNLAADSLNYYEPAFIVGHPALLPTTVTAGHFSGSQIITILIGMRKCTDDDFKDPAMGFICGLVGGLPIYESYQSQLVTATIMPGSSGSPIFNKKGELTGLAFAGQGSLGYAMAVPPDYVRFFLNVEAKTLKAIRPSYQSTAAPTEDASLHDSVVKLNQACQKAKDEKVNTNGLCLENTLTGDDLIHRN